MNDNRTNLAHSMHNRRPVRNSTADRVNRQNVIQVCARLKSKHHRFQRGIAHKYQPLRVH